jgi:hypothetical protein
MRHVLRGIDRGVLDRLRYTKAPPGRERNECDQTVFPTRTIGPTPRRRFVADLLYAVWQRDPNPSVAIGCDEANANPATHSTAGDPILKPCDRAGQLLWSSYAHFA